MKSLLVPYLTLIGCTLFAQVPNASFEFWTDQLPDEWITNSCPVCDPPWESYIVRQDSDAYAGDYNADLYSNGVFKPYAYTIFPASNYPLKLKFYTKLSFAPCVNDSGFVADTVTAKIQLLNNGVVVDSGFWNYTGPSITNYQLVEVPLSQSASDFDSCKIYFEGGNVFGGCGIIAEATRFKVDEVSIESASGCSAAFYYSKHIDTVNFSGNSNHFSVSNWMWDFDDGQTDTTQNPLHIFSEDRWHFVCLSVMGLDSTGISCTATYCDSILITHDCRDTSNICPPASLCCDAPIYDPVCGCDSITYDNACQATLWYGVTSFTPGPCITSANEISTPIRLKLSPNPAKEISIVSFELPEPGDIEFFIRNSLGQIVIKSKFTVSERDKFSKEINLKKYQGNIFLVEIRLNSKLVAVSKLLKE